MDVSDVFPYACEKCGNPVLLTLVEYNERKFKEGKYGSRIICPDHGETAPEPEHEEPPVLTRKRPPSRHGFVPEGNTKNLSLTPKERGEYGVTVTIREQETMELHTFTVPGPLRKALEEACDLIDEIGKGDWKIVCISNPISIFRDLQGSHDLTQVGANAHKLSVVRRMDLLEVIPHGEKRPT